MLPPCPKNLEHLLQFKNWIVYTKDNKIPYRADGKGKASPTDPSDWCDYITARDVVNANFDILGMGFCLSENTNLVCVDFDSYRTNDPAILAEHQQIHDAIQSYSELSPSGKGVHLWVRGKLPSKRLSQKFIEVYSDEHYMTVTFKPFRDVPIQEQQTILDAFKQHYYPSAKAKQKAPIEEVIEVMTPSEMLKLCSERMQGDLFAALWEGKEELWNRKKFPAAKYDSHSEADQALMNMFANFTRSVRYIANMWKSSPLAQSSKYFNDDRWAMMTARKATDRQLPVNKEASEAFKKKWEADPAPVIEDVQKMWTRPSGLIGQMAQYIYDSSLYPTQEVALAAAITLMAAICGRCYNTTSKSGLNLYTALLANSGVGKEAAATGIESLVNMCKQLCPEIEKFIGPFDIASAQALGKHLSDDEHGSVSFYSHIDEMGFWLQRLNDIHAQQNDRQLKRMLLLLYHKSGYGKTLGGAIYSDRAKNTKMVYSPAFSILGDTTPDEFWKSIDERSMKDGLASRLLIINCANVRPQYNERGAYVMPPPDMVLKLVQLAQYSMRTNLIRGVTVVLEDDEARAWQLKYQRECQDKLWADNASPTASLWSRAHLKVLRLGALLAIGQNMENPIVTIQDYLWARDLVEHGIYLILSKFSRGEVGVESEGDAQRRLVRKVLLNFWNMPYKANWLSSYSVSEEMHTARVVSLRYLQMHTLSYGCFRNFKGDNGRILNSILQSMCEAGSLGKEDMETSSNNKVRPVVYRLIDPVAFRE